MNWSQDSYLKAWHFATRAHGDQTYKGSLPGEVRPYINHLGSVAMELIWVLPYTEGVDGNLAVQCALLHDVLEDTPTPYQDVLDAFGPAVAAGVQALTKDETLPGKQAQMEDSLARIRQQPREVWMVKLADRITNLSPPPFHWDEQKIAHYRDEAKMILDALGDANTLLAERLAQRIDNYGTYLKAGV